jgi:hypothetical protein
MKKYRVFSKMRYLVLLTVAFVAGCASNGQEVSVIADTVRPTVSFTAPAAGDVNVPIKQKILVAFSEVMDQSTITPSTFKLTGPGLTAVSGVVATFGTSATFTPAVDLAANTSYTATITTGVKDLAGNAMAANYGWTFTTGTAAVVDITAPTVSVTSPTDTAIAVPIGRLVTIGFSEAMDPATVTTTTFKLASGAGLTPVTGTVTPTGTSAVFDPTNNLLNNTLYTATVTTGVKDLAGNAMVNNFVFTFTTGIIADTTAPTVISTIPLNLATGVANNSAVTATFSESMNPLSTTTATYAVKETVTGNNVPGAVNYNIGSRSAIFTPTALLTSGLNYTATVKSGVTGVKDLAGNPLALDKVWTFTVGAAADIIAPTVILVNPLDLATNVALNSAVHATFSEAMNPATISTATFTLKAGVNPIVGTVVYDVPSKIATFTPAANLVSGTTYTATVTTGSKDLAGNALAVNKVWSFTTGAVVVPAAVNLGSAGTFGIMATSAITNTGASTRINGDVSLDPGTSNGLLPVQVNGAIHINDTVSAQARADLLVAYNFVKNLPPGTTISAGADLGALSIPPGTYTSGSTMLVSTPLVLDAGGNANAAWFFQIGSSLTTTANVTLVNGAQAKNVFWVPTLDATVGVGSIFYGTIVSGRDVTAKTGAVINGRILAGATLAGTIALDTNTVNVPAP